MQYESDMVIGLHHREAIFWLTELDLWHEVVDLVVDCFGKVLRVIH